MSTKKPRARQLPLDIPRPCVPYASFTRPVYPRHASGAERASSRLIASPYPVDRSTSSPAFFDTCLTNNPTLVEYPKRLSGQDRKESLVDVTSCYRILSRLGGGSRRGRFTGLARGISARNVNNSWATDAGIRLADLRVGRNLRTEKLVPP